METSVIYKMKISRLTVDKLGVKLYDRVSHVLAELISNSYDADATEVKVYTPANVALSSRQKDDNGAWITHDLGYKIRVEDNGLGMTPSQVNDFYLRIGAERRTDVRRGNGTSLRFNRKVMGRKGVGKLAPFGICTKIEIITSGGERVSRQDGEGKEIHGYETAHLTLDYTQIFNDTDKDYIPEPGQLDGQLRQNTGTIIELSLFQYRRVPKLSDLKRQLSQRFGITDLNWKLTLIDTSCEPNLIEEVGKFDIAQLDRVAFNFMQQTNADGQTQYVAIGADNVVIDSLKPVFIYEDKEYPITGWVGFSKEPYEDDLMAGVRIYCRGKIATKTPLFNMGAGFTGEYDVRSYFVGELHADWLDEEEDLIQTDRKDILWSHALLQQLEGWGQSVIRQLGSRSIGRIKQKTWDAFREVSGIESRVLSEYPTDEQKPIRDNALELARTISQVMKKDAINDEAQVRSIADFSIDFAPHLTLAEELRQAAENHDQAASAMVAILQTARIAELSAFGRLANDRVKVIDKLEELKDLDSTVERDMQELVEKAPWLINPHWTPIGMNVSFKTIRDELEKVLSKELGYEVSLAAISHDKKRPDFVLTTQDNKLHLVEIKKPGHGFADSDMERLFKYVLTMRKFFRDEANKSMLMTYSENWLITLVCDSINLSDEKQEILNNLKNQNELVYISWRSFLHNIRTIHKDFVEEAQRQKIITDKRGLLSR